jgi:excisionase family DNA binding protein
MTGDTPPLLTYKQAAKLLQVSDRTVFTLVKTGQLKAVRFGHTVRIDRRDLDDFIQQAKNGCGVSR